MIEGEKERREQHGAALLPEKDEAAKAKAVPASSYLGPAIGNFSVQYNFQCIAIVLTIAMRTGAGYPQRSWVDEQSKSSVFVGCILGQMMMGYAGDVIGRGPALGMTLLLAAIGALASAILPWGQNESLYAIIVVCRFVIGFGLGGVYPLSATQAAEASSSSSSKGAAGGDNKVDFAEKRASAIRTSHAFFWQAPGTMAPYLVTIILRAALTSEQQSLQWRLILGIGAIPSLAVVFLRMSEARAAKKEKVVPERNAAIREAEEDPSLSSSSSSSPEKDKKGPNAATTKADTGRGVASTNATLLRVAKKPKYWRWMAGTGGTWLLLDISLYGFGLMGPFVVATTFSPDESVLANSWQQFAALAFTPPAVICTILLLKRGFEPKFLQYLGFYGMAVSFVLFLIVRTVPGVPDWLHYAVYCLINYATWFGPIVTTFLLPAATYPAATRATLNGFSSALSKVGAIIGTEALPIIRDTYGLNAVIVVNAVVSLLGAFLTHACTDNVLSEPIHYDDDELGIFDNDDAPKQHTIASA